MYHLLIIIYNKFMPMIFVLLNLNLALVMYNSSSLITLITFLAISL